MWSSYWGPLYIQRYRIKMGFDAIGNNWKTLSVHGEIVAAITKAGEDIVAGSLVSSSDPINEEMLNATLFLEVREFDRAIKGFQRALELCESTGASHKQHQAVLNNFALVYMRQERWEDAIKYLSKALSIGEPEFPELFANLLHCYLQQKEMNSALQLIAEGERFFPQLDLLGIFETANPNSKVDRRTHCVIPSEGRLA